MPFRHALAALCTVAVATPSLAEPVDDLMQALSVGRVVEVMREEGLSYADELAGDMMPSGADEEWRETAERIYDAERMEQAVRAGFAESLGETDLQPLVDFFSSDLGARVIELEIEAREAMVDPAVEEAARERYRDIAGDGGPRLEQLEAFVAANDLIEQNVTGALNASLAFYRGLGAGGALEIPEDEMLADVWSQEPGTREDTTEWLYAYLLMAYEPLSEDELGRYVDLSQSEEGEALNRALFAGFNDMYNEISYAMGLAAARQMAQTDL
ncbi:ribosomal protein L21 [Roseivivax halodurans JCM 10272]|uniref:Ribosomal protein L21 n=1 Tax=Roseivivax halodurans JCM 10272 TaxID=1449350 RepID=X7EDA2_9RHOB|nr:DUF2059 domain-containing protein [Roseivivax halodurans]ETX13108.1 ribosomal protein L21 [Roseivivax halodurans JCM 10272]